MRLSKETKSDKRPMHEDFFTPSLEVNDLSEVYEKIEKIGKGTYGKVYKCRDVQYHNQICALKKIKILKPNDGFPLNTIREIKLLRELHHDNIIRLRKIVTVVKSKESQTKTVYLAFDYCEFDLYGLLYLPDIVPLTVLQTLSFCRQLLLGMIECKQKCILHRDLKPANLFITRNNILKIGDFGLARKYRNDDTRYTSKVITLFYRAPELLLGSQSYQYEVDVWSVGCIFYELVSHKVLFKSKRANEMEQVKAIFELTGTPDLEEWPEFQKLDRNNMFTSKKLPNVLLDHLNNTIPPEYEGAADLISKMCTLTPSKRISMHDAYMHPFMQKYGDKIEPSHLPPIFVQEIHQMKAQKTRQQISQNQKSPPRPQQPKIE